MSIEYIIYGIHMGIYCGPLKLDTFTGLKSDGPVRAGGIFVREEI